MGDGVGRSESTTRSRAGCSRTRSTTSTSRGTTAASSTRLAGAAGAQQRRRLRRRGHGSRGGRGRREHAALDHRQLGAAQRARRAPGRQGRVSSSTTSTRASAAPVASPISCGDRITRSRSRRTRRRRRAGSSASCRRSRPRCGAGESPPSDFRSAAGTLEAVEQLLAEHPAMRLTCSSLSLFSARPRRRSRSSRELGFPGDRPGRDPDASARARRLRRPRPGDARCARAMPIDASRRSRSRRWSRFPRDGLERWDAEEIDARVAWAVQACTRARLRAPRARCRQPARRRAHRAPKRT